MYLIESTIIYYPRNLLKINNDRRKITNEVIEIIIKNNVIDTIDFNN